MSEPMKLTITDKNKIFRAVQEAKIPLEVFETLDVTPENSQKYTSGSNKASFVIKLKNSPLEFWIFYSFNSSPEKPEYKIRFSRYEKNNGLSLWGTINSINGSAKIDELIGVFKQWLEKHAYVYYCHNLQEPDLWKQYQSLPAFVSRSAFVSKETSLFTANEKEQIRVSLNEYRRLLLEKIKPTKEKEKGITERLDYLDKALDRLNRLDWRAAAISVVFGIGIYLALDTETRNDLFRLFEQAFNATRLLAG